MEKSYGRIIGWGAYVPEKIVTNHDLAKVLDTSHDWIVRRTGIHERRIAAPHETTATLSYEAGRAALAKANLAPTDLDLIIVATTFQDYLTPPTSSQVQHLLGATDVPAFVLTTGCTGFVYALSTAQQFISSGTYRHILIIGTELISRAVNWADRSTCVLFGDASGAVVMQASAEPCGLLSFDLGSDGSKAQHIIAPAGGAAEPFNADTFAEGRQYVQMNGREVFKFASRILGLSSYRSLGKAGLTLDEVDWIIPHQANLRIIQAAARDMNLSLDRFIINVDRYANTSAASIPLALCEALADGRVELDHKLLLVSFGAGLTWASTVLQMAPTRQRPLPQQAERATAVAELVAS